MKKWTFIESEESNGLTDVPGFLLSGVHADVRQKKDGRLDLGILYSPTPCQAAGVFTRNRVRAAPVTFCEESLAAGGTMQGVVANSGNANACTGEEGMLNTRKMAKAAALATGAAEDSFFVCSTGRIGRQMPMTEVLDGIEKAGKEVGNNEQNGLDFANCILTSDTRNKKISVQVTDGTQTVSISGVAKGAGMIRPDMATMLAFIATDLEIDSKSLKEVLFAATDISFNAITVDGDMSTNDTVLCLANGRSGLKWEEASDAFKTVYAEALCRVCEYLAYLVVGDGEKISKVVTLEVTGAASVADAKKVAYSIAHSALVKASWAGSDPNWGRVLCATGYSGIALKENQLSMKYNDVDVFRNGEVIESNQSAWKQIVANKHFSIEVDLGMGDAQTRLITSDLTSEYITYNMKE